MATVVGQSVDYILHSREDLRHTLDYAIVSKEDVTDIVDSSLAKNTQDSTHIDSPLPWTWRHISRVIGLYVASVAMATIPSMLGVILLELREQTGANLEQSTFLFTWMYSGTFIGCILVSVFFDKLHPELQLGVCCSLIILGSIVVPLSRSYYLVSVAMGLQGLSFGYGVSGLLSTLFKLCDGRRGKGPIFQAGMFFLGLGYALAPILAQPFIPERRHNNTTTNATGEPNKQWNSTHMEGPSLWVFFPSTFHPYLICCIMLSLPTALFYFQSFHDRCSVTKICAVGENRRMSHTWTKRTVTILLMMLVTLFFSTGTEISYQGLLLTYTVEGHQWTTVSANMLLTLYWWSYLAFRALGILSVRFVAPSILLGTAIATVFASLALLGTTSHMSSVVLWLTTGLMGASSSNLTGLWHLFADDYIQNTPLIVGLFQAAMFVGGSVLPPLLGHAIQEYSIMYVPYILLVSESIVCVMFFIIVVTGKCWTGKSYLQSFEKPINT